MVRTFGGGMIGLADQLSSSNLERVPESRRINDTPEHVASYGKVMNSSFSVVYALTMELIDGLSGGTNLHPSFRPTGGSVGKIADICCGPGEFTGLLADAFQAREICGIDLAQEVITLAQEEKSRLNTRFIVDDAMTISTLSENSCDLVTFMNGAHHMDSQEDVNRVLQQCERLCRPGGVLLVLDPIRLASKPVTELYLRTFAHKGEALAGFQEDFRDSMYASWTMEELGACVPQSDERDFFQMRLPGVPLQWIVGLPKGARSPDRGAHLLGRPMPGIAAREFLSDLWVLRKMFSTAKVKRLDPSTRWARTGSETSARVTPARVTPARATQCTEVLAPLAQVCTCSAAGLPDSPTPSPTALVSSPDLPPTEATRIAR